MFRKKREFSICLLSAVLAVVLTSGVAHASIIPGPASLPNTSGFHYSGIGFTATVNSFLTAFTFRNAGLADTVQLVDQLGNVIGTDSLNTPAATPTYVASVNWSLQAGHQYYLLQTVTGNGMYVSWGAAAPSDAEIAMTDTGDFSSVRASSGFTFGGAATGTGNEFWADFQNITTVNASAVPEPASFILVAPFAVAALLRFRRKRLVR